MAALQWDAYVPGSPLTTLAVPFPATHTWFLPGFDITKTCCQQACRGFGQSHFASVTAQFLEKKNLKIRGSFVWLFSSPFSGFPRTSAVHLESLWNIKCLITCCMVVHALCMWCHATHSLLIYMVQLYLFLLMFGSVWGCCREGNASSGYTFKLLRHPSFDSFYQNQSRAMELWQDHRAVTRFTDVASAAIPNTKSNTHLHIHPLTRMAFLVFLLFLTAWPSRLFWDPMELCHSHGVLKGSCVPQKLSEQTKCSWGLLLPFCPGSSLHIPSCCSWFAGLSQKIGIILSNH